MGLNKGAAKSNSLFVQRHKIQNFICLGHNSVQSSGGPALFPGSHGSSAVWNRIVLQMESAYTLRLNGWDYAAMTINFLVLPPARQLVYEKLVVR
ncbi:unnamed protein product [Danaus chrysippus]|uniref:(African queen) hypothetical protein n=1 Tax=Danaus chrysippus TaxID=151541 RepID=A0A8J2QNI4_9NEOP|nr:unnamed protein product [Danaus chrysippus]